MGQFDDMDHDPEIIEVLRHLVESEYLTKTGSGVARQLIEKGYDSLSDNQKSVVDEIRKKQCRLCHGFLLLGEVVGWYENGGYCSRHDPD